MNTDTLTPILFPTLLRVQAILNAHPRLVRALIWLAVFSAAMTVMLLAAHSFAQTAPAPPAGGTVTLNGLTDGTATKACTEVKSLTTNKWLKVFLVVGFGAALVSVARKQRDGWSNLIWVIIIAALLGSVWQVASGVFGIGC